MAFKPSIGDANLLVGFADDDDIFMLATTKAPRPTTLSIMMRTGDLIATTGVYLRKGRVVREAQGKDLHPRAPRHPLLRARTPKQVLDTT